MSRSEYIEHYRILRPLGRGGMGEVVLAEDTELERLVALKLVASDVVEAGSGGVRIRSEARALAALKHPAIVTVHQIGEHDGRTFIAMEYVEGRPLSDEIAQGTLGTARILELATQIAEGLAEAHRRGIIHRDVKPDNILIDEHGRPKIVDFGLAHRAGGSRITAEGDIAGTAAYMAPELIEGREIDARADVFSLGLVLYQLLTGQHPFAGRSPIALLYALVEQSPPSLAERHGELGRVVDRCLQKDPAHRYADASELLRALHQVAGTVDPEPSGKARRPVALLVVASALLLAAALVITMRGPERGAPEVGAAPPQREAVAVFPFTVRGDAELDYLREGIVELLATALDGAGALRSVEPRALFAALAEEEAPLTDPTAAREMAHRFEADRFVLGDALAIGDSIHLEASLHDEGGEVDRTHVEGPIAELPALLDQLAVQILTAIAGPGPLRPTAATLSLDALRAYLEGEQAFRSGQNEAAIEAYERAVAEDPEFALAYYRLSLAADWAARGELSRSAAEEALRRSDRLTEHDRLLLEAIVAWRRGRLDEAETLYRTILGLYPDDVEAWFQLGEVIFHAGPIHGRPLTDAAEPFERVLELEPTHVPTLWHLARISAAESDLTRLETLVDRIEALQPTGDRLLEIRALSAFAAGLPRERAVIRAALAEGPDLALTMAVWNVAVYAHGLEGAAEIAALGEAPHRSAEVRSLAALLRAHLELAQGRWPAAHESFRRAATENPAGALTSEALWAVLDLLPNDPFRLAALESELLALAPEAVRDNRTPNVFYTVHNGLYPTLRTFLLGALALRLGRPGEIESRAQALDRLAGAETDAAAASLTADLAALLRGWRLAEDDQPEQALAALPHEEDGVWYGLTVVSPFYSRVARRWLEARWLSETGRFDEALDALARFDRYSIYDLVLVAPAHLARAELFEARGEIEAAARERREAEQLRRVQEPSRPAPATSSEEEGQEPQHATGG